MENVSFVLPIWERDIEVQKIIQNVRSYLKDGENLIVISCSDAINESDVMSMQEYLINYCRSFGRLPNKRTTVLSPDDQMLLLQLSLAEQNKEEHGLYETEVSTVLQTYHQYLSHHIDTENESTEFRQFYKSFCKIQTDCNYRDVMSIYKELSNDENRNYLQNNCFLVLGPPKDKFEVKLLQLFLKNQKIYKVEIEASLGDGQYSCSCMESSEIEMLSEIENKIFTPCKKKSVTENYIKEILLSYIELLVNSRSEISLARTLNVPERELDHSAFTDLKRHAKERNMPMYQSAVSFVMRLKLGGKGYAPDTSSPIAQHIKGLGDYITLIQKLQTVVEEDHDSSSACRRMMNILKNNILKGKHPLKVDMEKAEGVVKEIQEQLSHLCSKEKSVILTPGKAACDGGSLLGRKTMKILHQLLDRYCASRCSNATEILCDRFTSQKTPLHIPSLVSQFRSPDVYELEEEDSYVNQSLSVRLIAKQQQSQVSKQPVVPRYVSHCDWATENDSNEIRDMINKQCHIEVIPSSTLVCTADGQDKCLDFLREEDKTKALTDRVNRNEESITANKKSEKEPSKKRKVLESLHDQENEPVRKPKKSKLKNREDVVQQKSTKNDESQKDAQKKSCRKKLLPQIKGQQSLAKFFR